MKAKVKRVAFKWADTSVKRVHVDVLGFGASRSLYLKHRGSDNAISVPGFRLAASVPVA
jgi:hypothetical protein